MRCFALERDRVRSFHTYQPFTRQQLDDLAQRILVLRMALAGRQVASDLFGARR